MKSPFLVLLLTVLLGGHLRSEVLITEFLAANLRGLTTASGEASDWIEIYNSGESPVNLDGYYLTDDANFSPDDAETFWRFPQVTLEADRYLIVFASGADEPMANELHANFKLNSAGERLALIASDGVTVLTDFSPMFPEQRQDRSYGLVSDGSFQFMLAPTPGFVNRIGVVGFADDVQFSVKHGFYEEPIVVALSTETEGAEIFYTLNDLEPGKGTIFTGPIGQVYTEPFEVSETTVVRARAIKSGLEDSVIRTQTYVFLDDILDQPDSPEGFPERWGTRTPDYEMDPDVVGEIYSREEMKAALQELPSISLVTENDNLFASDGIYTNSQAKDLVNDGIEDLWERPVSVELFGFPHGQTVQANAGIRIQGNASRNPNRVKHNMRLIFRADYGPGKLDFRLFEDSEVERYNSINLRSSNGDSWINPGVRVRAQYIRDQWHREVQRLIGQPNQSQIYAHLYINGLYWGVYHVFERFEASLLAEHFGGDEADWDALQDTPAFQDIVVNGDDVAFRETHDLAKKDLTVKENYEALLEYVDVDNQIDYLLINFYSGNQDWDHKNMRYARRRTPVEGAVGNGWTYFAWDSERAGLNGLSDQRLTTNNTGKRTALGPTLLNSEMHDNPHYHLRFADRVVKHCFNGGELTPEGAARSWNRLADLVYGPLMLESARWGDLHVSTPETREGNWQRQLDLENTVWFPNRTDVLLDQLSDRGFIPRKPAFPQFSPFGGQVEEGQTITMRIFNSTIFEPVAGDIFYTIDGTDPRLPDGSLNPAAMRFDPESLPTIDHTLTMMGRVYDEAEGTWTALGEVDFHLGAPLSKEALTMTEVHYAPASASAEEEAAGFEASDFEFLEFGNASDEVLDLSGLQITKGARARVEETRKASIAPGAYAVIVANREAFAMRYPEVPADSIVGEFADDSRLDNQGERLTLRDRRGLLLHTVRYNVKAPWPSLEDAQGHSMAFQGGMGPSLAHPENWVRGAIGGTPGTANQGAPLSQSLSDWLTARGLTDSLVPVGPREQPALLYYAMGMDDFEQEAALRVTKALSIEHTRRAGLENVQWVYESSSDLEVWATSPLDAVVLEVAGGVETVSLPVSGNGPAEYWRLRVSLITN